MAMSKLSATSFILLFFLFLETSTPAHAFEGLLQAAGEVRKDRPTRPLHFASPDWQVYHRTHHLQSRIRELATDCAYAKIASVKPSGSDSNSDETLDYVTITERPGSVREITSHLLRARTRLMFVFGEHGRDLISSEIALRIVEAVCSTNATRIAELGELVPLARARLSTSELVLVPLANPNGRKIAEMGRRCERTNANDVDIDRNWPHFWNEPSFARIADPIVAKPPLVPPEPRMVSALRSAVSRGAAGADALREPAMQQKLPEPAGNVQQLQSVLGGPEPFSEVETKSIKIIAARFKPNSYVSVRTGALAVTVPWDCKQEELPGPQQSRLLRITEAFTASHCTKCKTGNLWKATGRTKCGTGSDYMFGTLSVPFVHTWHVYQAAHAERGDCFRRHNPITRNGYELVTSNWAQAVFNFSAAVHNWIVLERTVGLNSAQENATLSAAEATARRADALARGVPDPEKVEELEKEGDIRQISAVSDQNIMSDPLRKSTGLMGWIFGVRHPRRSVVGQEQFHGHGIFGPRAKPRQASFAEDDGTTFLAGWVGASAALFLLCAGLFVARRYVFMARSKKSRFLRRDSVKHA